MCRWYYSHSVLLQCLVLVMSAYGSSSSIQMPNLDTDRSALLALKASITSDPDHILSRNWSSSAAAASSSVVCDWVGVQCSSRHRRVTSLDISNMRLTGAIPPHLGNLSFLVFLNMSHNYFEGNLPEEFPRLRRLRFVSLSFNNFTGEVPMWFGFLPQLESLFLASNRFTGSLPSSLSNLRKLQVLNVTNNFIGGTIPAEIGSLPSLNQLYLSFNNFQGQIPKEIGNLKKLERLYIGHNNLTGIIPQEIGKLRRLQHIHLYENNISGSIPREIGNLTMLTRLLLWENSLTGRIPDELGNLQKIEYLALGDNLLNGSIPSAIFNFSTLTKLGLSFNFLTGSLPSDMGNTLPNLELLQLHENSIGGVIPLSITNLTKLQWLQLNTNQFSGYIPENLGELRDLEDLRLFRNKFTRDPKSLELGFITSLANCKRLKLLGLDLNPLDGILPASIGNLSASLTKFYAPACQIQGSIPSQIGNLSGLIILALSGNHLTGVIPPTFKGMKNLQILDLGINQVGGNLDSLCGLQKLSEMMVPLNRLSGVIPECFGSMLSLRNVQLQENLLISTIPTSFWNLKDLMTFNFSSNYLNGSLPLDIGNLERVISIDISLNRFSGGIPITLGDLQSLIELSLAKNNFVGTIPESFGNMLSLAFLDLSNNSLSGWIPKSLESLQYLEYLNVSYNHLTGEIPSAGPFRNFSSESFMFNDALCGDAKFQVPPCPKSSDHKSRTKMVLLYVLVSLGITVLIVIVAVTLVLRKYRKKDGASWKNLDVVPTQERISYYELLQATGGYDESNLLGTGSFGSVYKGILIDGRFVAVKVFNMQFAGAFRSFDVECEVFRNVRHRNLVKVISSCSNPDFKALVLQYMSNNSLEKWLYSHNHLLDVTQRLNIMIDVASALHYLHHEYTTVVIHCDLKPSNVLLDEDMVAYVSDFGIAKMLGEEESIALTKTFATVGYIAPEYGSEGLLSRRSDVYSFGIMLMEVFTRKRPNDEMFAGDLSLKSWINGSMLDCVFGVIDDNLLNPSEEHFVGKLECVSSIMELALNCVCESPGDRLRMTEILPTLQKIKLKLLQFNG